MDGDRDYCTGLTSWIDAWRGGGGGMPDMVGMS